jgi:hypothetical protein
MRHLVGGVYGQLVGAPQVSFMPATSNPVSGPAGPLLGALPYTGNSPQVMPAASTRELKKWALGFGPQSVGATSVGTVISRPQGLFRPDRLIIPSGVASTAGVINFFINEIKIGQKSQLMNSNGLPAQMFVETATDTMFTFDTCDPACDVSIAAANQTAGALNFSCALLGAAVV